MFAVLGPLELGGRDKRSVGSAAQRIVLQALVLATDSVVSVDRLAELVWGDEQPGDPSGALQSHVSRLRRVLPEGAEIEAEGTGYRLRSGDVGVDVRVFEDAYARARAAAAAGEQVDSCQRALGLWRGDPYPDLDDPVALVERTRLSEMRMALIETQAEALVRLGRSSEAIVELEPLLAEDPLRETAVGVLMRAHVAAGRKRDALRVYARLRDRMVDETGLDPSPALRDLETAIITEDFVPETEHIEADEHDAAPGPGHSADQSGSVAHLDDQPPVVVPLPASTLVGRADELAGIVGQLDGARIVTLVGPGGVGKTRLALHAADSLGSSSAVHFVELASLQDPDDLAESMVSALRLPPHGQGDAVDEVVRAIGTRRRVIVLDNCEHLIDAVAAFVDTVVRRAPGAVFLTTSREALNVDAEHVVRIEPLAAADRADLFADRAALLGVEIGPADHAAVDRICAGVDGLPLAIELAAAQLGSLSLAELEASLSDPLEALGGGRRTSARRHQSLRSLVEWSVQDLDRDLEEVFIACALFAGPFTIEAVALASGQSMAAAGRSLRDLTARSLIVAEAGRRFVMLETIRAYAGEMLRSSSLAARAEELHSGWVLDLVDGASSSIARMVEIEKASAIRVHLADLRVAHRRFVSQDDADRGLRLTAALHYEAYFGMHAEIFAWIQEAAEKWGSNEHPLAETVLASAATGMWQAGSLERAENFADRAAAASAFAGADAGRRAAEGKGDLALFSGEPATAREWYVTAAGLAPGAEPSPRAVTNHCDAALAASYAGDADGALEAIAAARRALGEHGPLGCTAWVNYTEAEILARTNPDRAKVLLVAAIDAAVEVDAAWIIGTARLTLAGLELRTGVPVAAVPPMIELIEHWRSRGSKIQLWITLRTTVELLVALDEIEAAAAVLAVMHLAGAVPDDDSEDARRVGAARAQIEASLGSFDTATEAWRGRSEDEAIDLALDALDEVQVQGI